MGVGGTSGLAVMGDPSLSLHLPLSDTDRVCAGEIRPQKEKKRPKIRKLSQKQRKNTLDANIYDTITTFC